MNERWTAQADNRLLFDLGVVPLPKLARQLGRTPRAIQERCRAHGRSMMRLTAAAHGLSTQQCADALGVYRQRVQTWIRLGWLTARYHAIIERQIIVVAYDDLESFLQTRGGLLDGLRPRGGWADVVIQARQMLHARYMSRAAIAAIFCLPANTFGSAKWIRQSGFPAPALYLQHNQSWYERDTVRAWLRTAHSRYRTQRALRAFGLED